MNLLLRLSQDVDEQAARRVEQIGDLGEGGTVEHLTSPALRNHQVVLTQNRKVLRKVRGLDSQIFDESTHCDLIARDAPTP